MKKVSYKDIGLVNTRRMFKKAMEGKYAIPAYNFNNMEQLQAIVMGCVESKSPFILQVSSGRTGSTPTRRSSSSSPWAPVAMIKDAKSPVKVRPAPGTTATPSSSPSPAIDSGFSSVMIDGSHHSYEDNVKLTKKVVQYARKFDVTVEGELGVLAGIGGRRVGRRNRPIPGPSRSRTSSRKTGVGLPGHLHRDLHGANENSSPSSARANERGVLVPPPLKFEILE